MVILVIGLPGSGKSYFASKLAGKIAAGYINSDRVRKNIPGRKTYSVKEKLAVYGEMLGQMKKTIKQNKNVVLDGTFYKKEVREIFRKEIEGKESLDLIEIRADESLIRERLKKYRPDSEADFEVYKKIKKQWEPVDEPHLVLHSSDDNISSMLDKAEEYLNDKTTNR